MFEKKRRNRPQEKKGHNKSKKGETGEATQAAKQETEKEEKGNKKIKMSNSSPQREEESSRPNT